jgi:hypothetical protein
MEHMFIVLFFLLILLLCKKQKTVSEYDIPTTDAVLDIRWKKPTSWRGVQQNSNIPQPGNMDLYYTIEIYKTVGTGADLERPVYTHKDYDLDDNQRAMITIPDVAVGEKFTATVVAHINNNNEFVSNNIDDTPFLPSDPQTILPTTIPGEIEQPLWFILTDRPNHFFNVGEDENTGEIDSNIAPIFYGEKYDSSGRSTTVWHSNEELELFAIRNELESDTNQDDPAIGFETCKNMCEQRSQEVDRKGENSWAPCNAFTYFLEDTISSDCVNSTSDVYCPEGLRTEVKDYRKCKTMLLGPKQDIRQLPWIMADETTNQRRIASNPIRKAKRVHGFLGSESTLNESSEGLAQIQNNFCQMSAHLGNTEIAQNCLDTIKKPDVWYGITNPDTHNNQSIQWTGPDFTPTLERSMGMELLEAAADVNDINKCKTLCDGKPDCNYIKFRADKTCEMGSIMPHNTNPDETAVLQNSYNWQSGQSGGVHAFRLPDKATAYPDMCIYNNCGDKNSYPQALMIQNAVFLIGDTDITHKRHWMITGLEITYIGPPGTYEIELQVQKDGSNIFTTIGIFNKEVTGVYTIDAVFNTVSSGLIGFHHFFNSIIIKSNTSFNFRLVRRGASQVRSGSWTNASSTNFLNYSNVEGHFYTLSDPQPTSAEECKSLCDDSTWGCNGYSYYDGVDVDSKTCKMMRIQEGTLAERVNLPSSRTPLTSITTEYYGKYDDNPNDIISPNYHVKSIIPSDNNNAAFDRRLWIIPIITSGPKLSFEYTGKSLEKVSFPGNKYKFHYEIKKENGKDVEQKHEIEGIEVGDNPNRSDLTNAQFHGYIEGASIGNTLVDLKTAITSNLRYNTEYTIELKQDVLLIHQFVLNTGERPHPTTDQQSNTWTALRNLTVNQATGDYKLRLHYDCPQGFTDSSQDYGFFTSSSKYLPIVRYKLVDATSYITLSPDQYVTNPDDVLCEKNIILITEDGFNTLKGHATGSTRIHIHVTFDESNKETYKTADVLIPSVNCSVVDSSTWTNCVFKCGLTQSSTRTVVTVPPSFGGNSCTTAELLQSKDCVSYDASNGESGVVWQRDRNVCTTGHQAGGWGTMTEVNNTNDVRLYDMNVRVYIGQTQAYSNWYRLKPNWAELTVSVTGLPETANRGSALTTRTASAGQCYIGFQTTDVKCVFNNDNKLNETYYTVRLLDLIKGANYTFSFEQEYDNYVSGSSSELKTTAITKTHTYGTFPDATGCSYVYNGWTACVAPTICDTPTNKTRTYTTIPPQYGGETCAEATAPVLSQSCANEVTCLGLEKPTISSHRISWKAENYSWCYINFDIGNLERNEFNRHRSTEVIVQQYTGTWAQILNQNITESAQEISDNSDEMLLAESINYALLFERGETYRVKISKNRLDISPVESDWYEFSLGYKSCYGTTPGGEPGACTSDSDYNNTVRVNEFPKNKVWLSSNNKHTWTQCKTLCEEDSLCDGIQFRPYRWDPDNPDIVDIDGVKLTDGGETGEQQYVRNDVADDGFVGKCQMFTLKPGDPNWKDVSHDYTTYLRNDMRITSNITIGKIECLPDGERGSQGVEEYWYYIAIKGLTLGYIGLTFGEYESVKLKRQKSSDSDINDFSSGFVQYWNLREEAFNGDYYMTSNDFGTTGYHPNTDVTQKMNYSLGYRLAIEVSHSTKGTIQSEWIIVNPPTEPTAGSISRLNFSHAALVGSLVPKDGSCTTDSIAGNFCEDFDSTMPDNTQIRCRNVGAMDGIKNQKCYNQEDARLFCVDSLTGGRYHPDVFESDYCYVPPRPTMTVNVEIESDVPKVTLTITNDNIWYKMGIIYYISPNPIDLNTTPYVDQGYISSAEYAKTNLRDLFLSWNFESNDLGKYVTFRAQFFYDNYASDFAFVHNKILHVYTKQLSKAIWTSIGWNPREYEGTPDACEDICNLIPNDECKGFIHGNGSGEDTCFMVNDVENPIYSDYYDLYTKSAPPPAVPVTYYTFGGVEWIKVAGTFHSSQAVLSSLFPTGGSTLNFMLLCVSYDPDATGVLLKSDGLYYVYIKTGNDYLIPNDIIPGNQQYGYEEFVWLKP